MELDLQYAARALDTSAAIETPEHIRFDHALAGPALRILAYGIDAAIRAVILVLLALGLVLVDLASGIDGITTGAMLVVYFVLDWFYYVLFETIWSGRSPGKRILHLRVVGEDGRSVTAVDSMLRNLLRAADLLPVMLAFGWLPIGYAVGLVVMVCDPKFRRLGDIVAGTVVVVEDTRRIAPAIRLDPAPTADELAAIPARPQLSRAEIEGIELFLRRHGTLAPARERELAEMIAPLLAERMGMSCEDPVRVLGLLYTRVRGPAPAEQHQPEQPQARAAS